MNAIVVLRIEKADKIDSWKKNGLEKQVKLIRNETIFKEECREKIKINLTI
jgi:hypothetical protein